MYKTSYRITVPYTIVHIKYGMACVIRIYQKNMPNVLAYLDNVFVSFIERSCNSYITLVEKKF